MTPQPVGAPAYIPLPKPPAQSAGRSRGDFAADLRAALSPQEEKALEAVFGTAAARLPKRPVPPAVAVGRHIDVQA
jgi:hypothetical protein